MSGRVDKDKHKNECNDVNRKEVIAETQEKFVRETQNQVPVPEGINTYGIVNGIKIGTIWETRIECSEAGVHKPLDADIHVGSDGLYSMLLCGESKDNIDYGECITCTVSIQKNKFNLKNENKVRDSQRLSLSKNYDTGNPIRVIRSSDLNSPYAADRGFRYDGLYIVRKLCKLISDDGQRNIVKYALKRRENQLVAPWKEQLACEVSNPWNKSLATTAVKKVKDSPIKSQEPTSSISYASECERESVRDPLNRSNIIHSCLRKKCNSQKKCVTFGDELINNVPKSSFKEYLAEMSKKLDNAICKSTSNKLMNQSSLEFLSKTDKSGTKLSSEQSSEINCKYMHNISTACSSFISVQSEKMEKAKSSHIYMEENTKEKCSDIVSSSAENGLEISKDSDLQQHTQDSEIKSYENKRITTVDELFSVEDTRTDMVQRQEAEGSTTEKKKIAYMENSSSNSKVEKLHREYNSKENNVGGKVVNDDSTVEIRNHANDVELHQLKDTSEHVMVREPEELSQEISDNGDGMQNPKQNSNHIVKSVLSSGVNATIVVSHSPKQDSLEISSKIENDAHIETAGSESKQISGIVGAMPASSNVTSETKIIGLQSSSQNCIIEPVNVSEFGNSVTGLCLQLSESSPYKTGARSTISANETRKSRLEQKQNSEKSSNLLKHIKAIKHKTMTEAKSVTGKRTKYTEKFVDSKITSSNAHGSKRSLQLLNPMDCNSFSHLKASKNSSPHIKEQKNQVNDNVSRDVHTFKENKSDEKCNLYFDKNSSNVSAEKTLMLESDKLTPVVNLTKISNEHVKKFCSPKKSVNSKISSRKKNCTSRDMKEKRELRECHVQLTRLPLPFVKMIPDKETDSWCGWQVHVNSLRSACNAEVLTISDGDTQTRTLIWGRDDDGSQVPNDIIDTALSGQSSDTDESWKGWNVVTAYTDIDDECSWFEGW